MILANYSMAVILAERALTEDNEIRLLNKNINLPEKFLYKHNDNFMLKNRLFRVLAGCIVHKWDSIYMNEWNILILVACCNWHIVAVKVVWNCRLLVAAIQLFNLNLI